MSSSRSSPHTSPHASGGAPVGTPAPSLVSRLARWRVPLGFAFAVLALWLAQPTRTSLLLGAIVAAIGEGLRIWAAGHLNKSREVTSSGPYRYFAHPLYVGSSVMALGVAVAAASILVALATALYMGATITAAIRHEEAFLRATFGPAYDTYRGGASSDRPFSWQQVMVNREYRAALGLVLAGLLLLGKATYNGSF